jgi:hypothetical protein
MYVDMYVSGAIYRLVPNIRLNVKKTGGFYALPLFEFEFLLRARCVANKPKAQSNGKTNQHFESIISL